MLAQIGLGRLEQNTSGSRRSRWCRCLAIREKTQLPTSGQPSTPSRCSVGRLLGQKKYAEAEPLLLAGYEEMKKRGRRQSQSRARFVSPKAIGPDCLLELYKPRTNKPNEMTKRRAERGAVPRGHPAEGEEVSPCAVVRRQGDSRAEEVDRVVLPLEPGHGDATDRLDRGRAAGSKRRTGLASGGVCPPKNARRVGVAVIAGHERRSGIHPGSGQRPMPAERPRDGVGPGTGERALPFLRSYVAPSDFSSSICWRFAKPKAAYGRYHPPFGDFRAAVQDVLAVCR